MANALTAIPATATRLRRRVLLFTGSPEGTSVQVPVDTRSHQILGDYAGAAGEPRAA